MLGDNNLGDLPNSMKNLKQLLSLYLKDNNFKERPEVLKELEKFEHTNIVF
jgi:Leucine-rich repeat (LRR) protein